MWTIVILQVHVHSCNYHALSPFCRGTPRWWSLPREMISWGTVGHPAHICWVQRHPHPSTAGCPSYSGQEQRGKSWLCTCKCTHMEVVNTWLYSMHNFVLRCPAIVVFTFTSHFLQWVGKETEIHISWKTVGKKHELHGWRLLSHILLTIMCIIIIFSKQLN